MEKQFAVYIMASKKNGTIYVGCTSNLQKRIWEHKNKIVECFTEKYDVCNLVYYELHGCAESAIKRERRLKEWPRKWKLDLIEQANEKWNDLYEKIIK